MLSAKSYLHLEQTLFKFAHVVSDPQCEWCQGTGIFYEHDYGPNDERLEWQEVCICIWDRVDLRMRHPDDRAIQTAWLFGEPVIDDEVPF